MQDYRRLLLVAILAWSASAVAVHAENETAGEPCNVLCRFWLGRAEKAPQQQPVVAAQAPSPVAAGPQDPEPDTPPIVRMKRKAVLRTRRPASAPPASLSSELPVEEEQTGAAGSLAASPPPAAASPQPMDLTPDEAVAPAEPAPELRLPPIPPHRPPPQRQARSRRPVHPPKEELPVSLSVAATRQGSGQAVGPSTMVKPATAPAAPAPRPSSVAVASPDRPLVEETSGLLGTLPTSSAPSIITLPGVATPAPAAVSSLDAGSTSVGRTVPAADTAYLHDVAPGPKPAITADSTATVPAAGKRPDNTNPDEMLEDLKATILRSAQETLKQSEGHGGF